MDILPHYVLCAPDVLYICIYVYVSYARTVTRHDMLAKCSSSLLGTYIFSCKRCSL